jgi:hypothetical protein
MKLMLFMSLATALTSLFVPAAGLEAPAKFPANVRHDAWTKLLQTYVDERGLVAYREWKADTADMKALDDYLAQFAAKPAQPAQGDDLAASAINAYNAFAIRWILQHYPTESIQAVPHSFTAAAHPVGGEKVSLDRIEHSTLRPLIGWRTHAVLVCCARSCPPLLRTACVSGQLNQQIDRAYTDWLAREDLNRFLPEKKKAEISSVFKWFNEDFEKAGGIKKVLAIYAPESQRSFLRNGDFEVDYLKYHWGLNDQSGQGSGYSTSDLVWDKVTGTFKRN